MTKHFNMTFAMVKLNVHAAWKRLKKSIYVLDETILSGQINIFQTMHGGLTFISVELAHQLIQAVQAGDEADSNQRLVIFRFLVVLSR